MLTFLQKYTFGDSILKPFKFSTPSKFNFSHDLVINAKITHGFTLTHSLSLCSLFFISPELPLTFIWCIFVGMPHPNLCIKLRWFL